MGLDVSRIQAVLFDYGNTLIRFSRPEVQACDEALVRELERLFGHVDPARVKELRDADRVEPYRNGLRERKLDEMTLKLVQELYGRTPSPDQIASLVKARYDAVVQAIQSSPYIYPLLASLCQRFRLGIVSNYPDGDAIRASLQHLDLTSFFECVVVSADSGRVKPHRLPFQTCLDAMGLAPEQTLYVGDNWLADVQGAKKLGMQMVRTIQYEAPERFDPQPGDLQPDAVIAHLTELERLLGIGV